MKNLSHIPAFVKYRRQQAGLTQKQLADKAGVGLRFVRDLEQGKQTLRMDKINAVLTLFGFELKSDREGLDAYSVWVDYFNKGIILTLKNKEKLPGIIIEEILDKENKIVAWKFVPNPKAKEYQKTENKNLLTIIEHKDIESIEFQ